MLARFAPTELLRGMSYPLRGLRVLRQHRDLARYWLMPMVVTTIAICASIPLAIAWHDDLLHLLWREPAAASSLHWLYTLAEWTSLLLASVALLFLCVVGSTVIAAPFNDMLSEAVEQRVTGRTSTPFAFSTFLREIGRTIALSVLRLTAYVAIVGPLWVVSWWAPVIGHAVYVAVWLVLTAAYFALDYVDWPAARSGLPIRARFALLGKRPLLMLGFGLSVWLSLFVPLLNLAFMPLSVAGGTLLFLDLQAGEQRAS